MPSRYIERPTLLGGYYNGSTRTGDIIGVTHIDVSTLVSDGHYGYPDFPPLRNVGGAFIRYGQTVDRGLSGAVHAWRGGSLKQSYQGHFMCPTVGSTGSEPAFDGSSWGPMAYKRMKPTKPLFDLALSIGEIKDLPKMLFRLKEMFDINNLKQLGNYHLALQFGWMSLLRETKATVEFQQKISERLKWLLRHNGKPVRRKVILAESSTEPVISSGSAYGALNPVLSTQFYRKVPEYQLKTWDETKIWASARFRYHLPPGPRDVEWTKKMMYKLYGARPSPATVYNLIPWSWLIDYFSNLGDIIDNLDVGVADRLAADYFYLMSETSRNRRQEAIGYFWDPALNPITVSTTSSAKRFRKTRLKGDPFGFGSNPNDLSAMQLSILGALGLSRL